MGNQLVNSVKNVPSIRPIDHYLSEVPEFKFKHILGQTQFLKVALCSLEKSNTNDDNNITLDVVIKVLSHEDPSLPLEAYRANLLQFASITSANLAISSFRIVEIRHNFAYIARQYFRYSLYDRLSTRPFLTLVEKCWIAYQVLKCLEWCYLHKVHHGDLKLENIMVNSNLQVVLTDFATYKPVWLPDVSFHKF